jgi:hypothetical protein
MNRLPWIVGALALALAPAACTLARSTRLPPLPLEATSALAEARTLMRERPPGWRRSASERAERAAAAAPDWVAPARVLDDLAREDWLGHEALAARRAALAERPGPAELYLAGRLEGRAGRGHLERAARLDPAFAWAQHGLAWHLFLEGRARVAVREGRRALELARGSYELGQFASAEARYLLALERDEAACELLLETLADARLAEPERTELAVALAEAELGSRALEIVERGFFRGLATLEANHLAPEEYERLGEALLARRGRVDHPDPLAALLAALEHGSGEARERLRARVRMERGAHALAAAAWARAGAPPSERFGRTLALERGAAEAALAAWNADLPRRLCAEDGLPREPALRALVLASRECHESAGALRFGEALLAAGWFDEAESFASSLADEAPEAALALAARAASGQALLADVLALLERVDEGRAARVRSSSKAEGEERELDDLDDLLAALEPLFARHSGAPLAAPLASSPRLGVGGLAEIIHPGPRFSALDAREGRGREGDAVPGLAFELERLGRFGIFGHAPFSGGPDGTILRRVGGEWVSGEHLGVPYSGYVAWCEGADVPSRPGRSGAGVSGAALHEGYWIDLEGVRRDWERLRALERELDAAEGERVARALAGRGPRLAPGARATAEERALWLAPLGEGARVFLAVLGERPARAGGRVTLDELLALTAQHEEGHLTDHTRFLPLARNWGRAFTFALRHGFSPRAIGRALEYRAQLVALCVADEPRLVLAECLAAAEAEGGPLPHGEAYRELVEDLLVRAARAELPALSNEHYVLYQLHLLSAADVRALALELARDEGLVEDEG